MPDTVVVLLLVLVIALVWRGPKTLPGIGRMLGRGVKNARDEAKSMRNGDADQTDQTRR